MDNINYELEILFNEYIKTSTYKNVKNKYNKIFKNISYFTQRYKKDELYSLSKEEYAKGKNSFIKLLHDKLNDYGSIKSGNYSKFGVYYGNAIGFAGEDWRVSDRLKEDKNTNVDESMSKLALELQDLVDNAFNKENYNSNKIAPTIKMKILSVYYIDDFLPMYSGDYIMGILDIIGIPYNEKDNYSLNNLLLSYKKSNPLFENLSNFIFANFLYWILTNEEASKNKTIAKKEITKKKLNKVDFNILKEREIKPKRTNKGVPNFEKINKAKKIAGSIAEMLVIEYEKSLGNTVKHIANKDSSAGYDILSISDDKVKKYIEVKSLSSGSLNKVDFYITENEYEKLKNKENYYIYYVFNVNQEPKFIEINKTDLENINPKPVVYKYNLKTE